MKKRVLAVVLVVLLCVGAGSMQAGAAFTTTPMIAFQLVLRADGTVWGMEKPLGSSIAYIQLDGLADMTAVALGGENMLALKSDGTVWKITGTYVSVSDKYQYTAAQVAGLSGVTAIAAGYYTLAAVKGDGTVWVWGATVTSWTMLYNLPAGTPIYSTTPIQVPGVSGIISVDLGMDHAVALKNDGTVWTWGVGYDGQLGRTLPAGWQGDNPGMVPGFGDAKAVAAGREHTLVLKNDGTVWGFGRNASGEVGNGTFTKASSPVQAQGLSGVRSIALTVNSGARYSVAVKNDNTLWVWGDVYDGYDVGLTEDVNMPIPTKVLNLDDVAYADGLMSAIKSDGTCLLFGNPPLVVQMVYSDGTPLNVYDGLPPTPTTYTVTVVNGTGSGEYEAGAAVTITANTAPTGQRFKQWNITPSVAFTSGSATSATAKFTMPAQAVTATAVYENINNPPPPNPPGPGKLFRTKYDATFINWILFFVCFGWLWMWF